MVSDLQFFYILNIDIRYVIALWWIFYILGMLCIIFLFLYRLLRLGFRSILGFRFVLLWILVRRLGGLCILFLRGLCMGGLSRIYLRVAGIILVFLAILITHNSMPQYNLYLPPKSTQNNYSQYYSTEWHSQSPPQQN